MITVALLIAVVATAAFITVVVGIRTNERRTGLPCPARGRADAFARFVLRADVQQLAISSRRSVSAGHGRGIR